MSGTGAPGAAAAVFPRRGPRTPGATAPAAGRGRAARASRERRGALGPKPGAWPSVFGESATASPRAVRPGASGVSSTLSVLCVLGVWPEGSDGTDINAICRAHERKLLSTGDDFGKVHLFSYPCSQFRVSTFPGARVWPEPLGN